GQSEEEEEDLRVERVRARRRQGGAEVVPHEARASEPDLEVVRLALDAGEGRGRVRREAMRAPCVHLLPDEVRPGLGKTIEELMPAVERQQHDVVGRSLRLRTR